MASRPGARGLRLCASIFVAALFSGLAQHTPSTYSTSAVPQVRSFGGPTSGLGSSPPSRPSTTGERQRNGTPLITGLFPPKVLSCADDCAAFLIVNITIYT